MFEVHFIGVRVFCASDQAVDKLRARARNQHGHAHYEDPNQQLHLDVGVLDREQDKGDQGHAGDAVGFKAVSAGANRVACVVACAVGDDARVASVVFFDLEDDLHQVGADVGDLGKDAAGNTQSSRAE